MHILMTADTVGGVWTYTRELVTQLSRRGVQVTLVSFGEIPSAAQTEWLDALPGVDYLPTAFGLEWMQDMQEDLEASSDFLGSIIKEAKPDLLHLNQFFYGALDCDVPRLVVAHSDVVSWWVAVHGAEPPESDWIRQYRQNLDCGLAGADIVVAPTQWMLDQLSRHYVQPKRTAMLPNGRDPSLFTAHMTKENFALSVGRLWDAGKQVSLLAREGLPISTVVVGSERGPLGAVASARGADAISKLEMRGPQSELQLRQLFARATVYVATSRYEPFGLAPLEAALSRCAIVANDIPTFREVWGETAIYFQRNDTHSLIETLRQLATDRRRCSEFGNRALERARQRFTSDRMAQDYLELYRTLVPAEVVAA